MSGIMLNEDCNHFVYTRHKSGIKVGRKELLAFVDQYADTQVKELVFNVNGMLAWFPAKSRQNAIDKYERMIASGKDPGNSGEYAETSYSIFAKQGLDMYAIWMERSREKGISPWISIRMNDIHNNTDEHHFLHSSFFLENKHLRRAAYRPHSGYYDNALDYTFSEVREHYLSFIREAADRYDFDGLEIDWMREPYSLRIGGEWEGIKILTGFMSEVREILNGFEKIRKHKIKMSVRVPQSPEMALRFGFDAVAWARSGLVDVIIPTPRWATIDNDMPIDLWKRILDGTGVMLGAGLEIIIEATSAQPKRVMFNSVETVRGSAAAYLGMGAERIYLFNYMDLPAPDSYAPSMAGTAVDPRFYKTLLTTVGDPETACSLPRRHITTYHDIAAPGTRAANALPVSCNSPDASGRLDFWDVRIVTGPVQETSELTLIIGAKAENKLDASDFLVYLNGIPCEFDGAVVLPGPSPECSTYGFKINNRDVFPEAGVVEIASRKTPFVIEWIEISVR